MGGGGGGRVRLYINHIMYLCVLVAEMGRLLWCACCQD